MTHRYKYLDARGEHLHTLDGRPLIGTSRVCSILAKPLTWWASGLAVQAFGCPDPKVLTKIKNGKATVAERDKHNACMVTALRMIQTMTVTQFSELIDKAYRAHATTLKEKAVAGTDLHAELERYVKQRMEGRIGTAALWPWPKEIQPFVDWTDENVKRFLWSEGHCYSEKHWLGGICDVGYEKHDGTFGIGDFKSAKDAYFEHFTQIAGYHIQIDENGIFDADGNLIMAQEYPYTEYIVVPFGAPKVFPRRNFDQLGMRETFLHMLAIYKKMPQDS